jgi:hypothetical protein
METTVFSIKFKDGREFRVFCANRKQKQDVIQLGRALGEISEITNGVHTASQFKNQFIDSTK